MLVFYVLLTLATGSNVGAMGAVALRAGNRTGKPPADYDISLGRSMRYDSPFTYACEEPLGEIREKFYNGICFSDAATCCGPLQNFTSCNGYTSALPEVWVDGVCSGYSVYDCCFEENGVIEWVFTNCSASQAKMGEGLWDSDDTCTAFFGSDCCMTDVLFTSCPESYRPIAGLWSDEGCYGLSVFDCCSYHFLFSNGGSDYSGSDNSDSSLLSPTARTIIWCMTAVAVIVMIIPCACSCRTCGPLYGMPRSEPKNIAVKKTVETPSDDREKTSANTTLVILSATREVLDEVSNVTSTV